MASVVIGLEAAVADFAGLGTEEDGAADRTPWAEAACCCAAGAETIVGREWEEDCCRLV